MTAAESATSEPELLRRLRAVVGPAPAHNPEEPVPGGAAAVLVLADPTDPGLPVLFMRRTRLVPSHRGQISFPGGGVEPDDRGPVETALREAHEEMAVDRDAVEVLGVLDSVLTATAARRLTPVVAIERTPLHPVPDPFEVAEWFRVALADLLDAPLTSRPIPGMPGRAMVHFYEVDGRVIWGATAAIIHDLLERLRRAE
jgi:8-oxo-dGTP pyrophosphatase MutT (NUDIX family)